MITDILSLKRYLVSNSSLNVSILDNNMVEFLTYLNDEQLLVVFENYHIIFIPEWVRFEINDSDKRRTFIDSLNKLLDIDFYFIDENDYLELVDSRDLLLMKIFFACCFPIAEVNSFIQKNIIKRKDLEDIEIEYNAWLKSIYENGFKGDCLANGRIKRKNAGEISILVLSYLLAYHYNSSVSNITILTYDKDVYAIKNKAQCKKFCKDEILSQMTHGTITFKTNNLILWELINHNRMDNNLDNINRYRKQERIKLTISKDDNSIEEVDKNIPNEEFMRYAKDNNVHIIF